MVYNFFGSEKSEDEEFNKFCLKLILGDVVHILEECGGTDNQKNISFKNPEFCPIFYRVVSRVQNARFIEENRHFPIQPRRLEIVQ